MFTKSGLRKTKLYCLFILIMSHQYYAAYSAINLYLSLIFRTLCEAISTRNCASSNAYLSFTRKRSPVVTSTVNVEVLTGLVKQYFQSLIKSNILCSYVYLYEIHTPLNYWEKKGLLSFLHQTGKTQPCFQKYRIDVLLNRGQNLPRNVPLT